MFRKLFSGVFLTLVLAVSFYGQFSVRPTESGGVLSEAQASYDVQAYDLALRLFPDEKRIEGVLTVKARVVKPLKTLVLDLDSPLKVENVKSGDTDLKFARTDKQILVELPKQFKGGENLEVAVKYAGTPRTAPHPPWVGGFVWAKTASGEPWISTAVQMDGSDLWFPVKDHPSDKPETTSLHFTVPNGLVAASNGRLVSVEHKLEDNKGGTSTFHWFVSQPISNYNISLNVAPYKLVEDEMKSVAGDTIPIWFYVLPENEDKAQGLIDKTKEYVRFFEEYLGPFPFRADKLGIVETPHLGMEHQSIIAYGNKFQYDQNGFDWLMFHELGHEWWANLVTAPDWNDFWIHEGFQSFMDALYIEKKLGRERFAKTLPFKIRSTDNLKPLAPREPRTTTEMYLIPPDYTQSDGDIYGKGALVLNSLRGLLGDEVFFKVLRQTAYPNPQAEKITSGKQVRFTTTDDFMKLAEKVSGKNLKWFFEVYVRQPKLPKLVTGNANGKLNLRWETPDDLPFPMPVEVKVGDEIKRVEMKGGKGSIAVPVDSEVLIDPNGWLLREL